VTRLFTIAAMAGNTSAAGGAHSCKYPNLFSAPTDKIHLAAIDGNCQWVLRCERVQRISKMATSFDDSPQKGGYLACGVSGLSFP
jgi:hypothetical protein